MEGEHSLSVLQACRCLLTHRSSSCSSRPSSSRPMLHKVETPVPKSWILQAKIGLGFSTSMKPFLYSTSDTQLSVRPFCPDPDFTNSRHGAHPEARPRPRVEEPHLRLRRRSLLGRVSLLQTSLNSSCPKFTQAKRVCPNLNDFWIWGN